MARRLSILSGLFAAFLVIILTLEQDVRAQTNYFPNTIANLNAILNGNGGNPLVAGDVVYFNLTGPMNHPGILVSTENINGTPAALAYNLTSNKSGSFLWRIAPMPTADPLTPLPNNNILRAGTQNFFNVYGGTVELMRGSSITLEGAPANTTFTLGSGTTLNARGFLGGVGNTITAPSIVLGNNTNLGIDLTNQTGGNVLTLNGPVSLGNDINTGNINLLGFKNQANSTVNLLQFNYAGTAPAPPLPAYPIPPIRVENTAVGNAYGFNFGVLVRGETWAAVTGTGRLAGTITQGAPTPAGTAGWTSTVSITNMTSHIGSVTWNSGGANKNWNATSANWTGDAGTGAAGYNTFLHGDSVTFGPNGANETITIQAGGVQVGQEDNVTAMTIQGGNYTFQNALTVPGGTESLIGIDGPGRLHITSEDFPGGRTISDVNFNSSNSYWGGTLIDNESVVTIKNSGAFGTGGVVLNNDNPILAQKTQLIFNTGNAPAPVDIFYNDLTASANTEIVKLGGNTVRLNGTNVGGTGDTTIREGVLQGKIPTGVLTVYDGATYNTFDASANGDRLISGLRNVDPGIGGTVNMLNRKLTINTTDGTYYDFSGLIVGTGASVSKTGTGTQVFSNEFNTYTGGTEVLQGTLVGKQAGMISDILQYQPFGTGTISIAKGATLQFDLSGGIGAFEAIVANQISDYNPGGTVGTPGGTLLKTGTEILHLTSNSSNYTGETHVKAGILRVGALNATGKTGQVLLEANTAIQFQLSESTHAIPYNRIITGAGDVKVLDGVTDIITGEVVTNVLHLKGTNDDTFSNPPPSAWKTASNYTGVTSVGKNAELHLLDISATGKTNYVDLTDSTSRLALDFAQQTDTNGKEIEFLYDRQIKGNGNLVVWDNPNGLGGVVVLNVDPANPAKLNEYKGTTTINGGTLKLMYASGTGALKSVGGGGVTVHAGSILELAFDGNYEKDITGPGIVAKSGTGTVSTLGGNSDYTGGTYLYSGTLSFNGIGNNPGNLPDSTAGVTFLHGGGILRNTGAAIDWQQPIIIYGSSTGTFETLSDLTINGDSGITHKDILTDDPYYDPNQPGSNFIKTGGATMTINADANWTGTTTVQQGILKNNIPDGTVLTVNGIKSEYWTGDVNRRVTGLFGTGTVNTQLTQTFTIDNVADNSFDGTIIGNANLVKTNNGILTLNGTSSYTGDTIIKQGVVVGNIAPGSNLILESDTSTSIYRAGTSARVLRSISGYGIVDMQNKNLTIQYSDDPTNRVKREFFGPIQNGAGLAKYGDGTQQFSGLTYNFANDVSIYEGTLGIGGASYTSTMNVGGNLNVAESGTLLLDKNGRINVTSTSSGRGTFNLQGTLDVNTGNNLITANQVLLASTSTLNISGISETNMTQVIIRSATPIDDDFGNVTIAGEAASVDYLVFGVSKSANKKEISIGQTLRWYSSDPNYKALGTFTINNPTGSYTIGIPLNNNTSTNLDSSWDGTTLTKAGPGTLILATENGYSGPTNVKAGTLKLTNEKATVNSNIVLSPDTNLEFDFDSRDANKDWTFGMTTNISGTGNLVKTGYLSVALYDGVGTFTGSTDVKQGVLLVDGSLKSQVWVRSGAGFGGNGTIDNRVSFENNSYMYWRFNENGGDTLKVDTIDIGTGVMVKPQTTMSSLSLPENLVGWHLVEYGDIYGEFAGIDQSANPFYNFFLDYSQNGVVKINGHRRTIPRALSDIVATSMLLPQTRMYRTAFQQISNEWLSTPSGRSYPTWRGLLNRGQQRFDTHAAWATFIGRGENIESTYFDNQYAMQSYGVQAGASFYSDATRSFGLLFGSEKGMISNFSDKVENEDYYLGLYYGQLFRSNIDLKTYIGGGWQKNDLTRTSNDNRYTSRYNGSTFNLDAEIGRRFTGKNNWMIRPFIGADLAVRQIGGSTEKSIDLATSNEYRSYNGTTLTTFITRTGIDTSKSWNRVDIHGGTQVGLNLGDRRPVTRITYPKATEAGFVRDWVDGTGADIGRFEWGFNVGMNVFLTEKRNALFFIDYNADWYLDRDKSPLGGTGTTGFSWRF
ncbi:MAG: autotransporter-associated beta strand repeat-containing protein [Thermoguttaceae bacterium]